MSLKIYSIWRQIKYAFKLFRFDLVNVNIADKHLLIVNMISTLIEKERMHALKRTYGFHWLIDTKFRKDIVECPNSLNLSISRFIWIRNILHVLIFIVLYLPSEIA